MPIDWKPLIDLIDRCQRFLLTTHQRADCDALGSELALAMMLEGRGKEVLVVNADPPPEHIRFMDPGGRIKVLGASAPLEALRGFDAMIVVDTSAWGQLGAMADVLRAFAGERGVIDHHVSEDDFGALVCKDSTAEATGRLILELGAALGAPLTTPMAEALFAAIATDTGWFRFNSVTPATFTALAQLTAAGARPASAFAQLFEQHTLPRLLLRGKILNHVSAECEGRLLWTYVDASDFAQTGARQSDTEDAINLLLTVAGSQVAALFVELEPAVTKVSLRSRSDFDVRLVAETFGGGGHRAAAGITMPMASSAAQQAVLDALRTALG